MADAQDETATVPPPRPYPPNSIHLVRTLQQLTMQLSQMADQKASILMGATFVVFTIAIGQASRASIPISLMVLAGFAFVSALLAVSAVMPRIGSTKGPIGSNLLFFGNFTRMSESEFVTAVKSRLHADDDFIETMLRDIHQNGMVLAQRKYRFLGLAYRMFVAGLVVTMLVFLWEHLFAIRH